MQTPPPQPPIPAIQSRALIKKFEQNTAVNGLDFQVMPGETVGLLGGNGAGKTTTISMILGLLLPTSGDVSVFGVDMATDRYQVLPRINFW